MDAAHPANWFEDANFQASWQALCEEAADRNVFFEPWMLVPALRHLAPSGRVELFAGRDEMGKLTGLVPLIRGGRPLRRIWTVWAHTHCFDNTPPVRADAAEMFFSALFARLEAQGARILRWPALAKDTVFATHLFHYLAASGRKKLVLRETARPLLRTDLPGVESYLAGTLSRSRRRGVARRRRRLQEIGNLRFEQLGAPSSVERALAAFLDLEASGWKGRGGSAISEQPKERAFFEEAARRGAELGRVIVHSLELDERPIAMTVNLRSGRSIWAFKTAYDEDFSAFAPGVLAEIEGTCAAIEDPVTSWLDSCTGEYNTLMAELWPDRRPLCDVMISVRPGAALELNSVQAAARAYRGFRALGGRVTRLLGAGGRETKWRF